MEEDEFLDCDENDYEFDETYEGGRDDEYNELGQTFEYRSKTFEDVAESFQTETDHIQVCKLLLFSRCRKRVVYLVKRLWRCSNISSV